MNLGKKIPNLAEIEREVIAESREWGRKRLEERVQELADELSKVFPPSATQASEAEPAQRTGKNRSKR